VTGAATIGHDSAMTVDAGDDRALVEALQQGDEGALGRLRDAHDATMRRLAGSSADRVVPETWRAVEDGIAGFEHRTTLKTWLFRLLLDRVPEALRPADDEPPTFARRRFRGGVGPTRGWWRKGAGPGALATDASVVAAAVDALPGLERTVLVLRDVDGWAAAETCDLLALSEARERALLHRARGRVRQALEDAAR
jgi:RNA polymerase sigma-70 factor (ECF subfamily)